MSQVSAQSANNSFNTSDSDVNLSVEKEKDRSRYVSGSLALVNIQDIRKYYSPDKSSINKSGEAVDSQSGGHRSRSLKRNAEKIKAKARRIASSSASVKRCYARVTRSQNTVDKNWTDTDSESDRSPGVNCESRSTSCKRPFDLANESEPSKEFLQHLSQQLRTISDQEVTDLLELKAKKRMKSQQNSSEAAMETNQVDSVVEDNDSANPRVMSLETIAVMFTKIQQDMKTMKNQMDDIQKGKGITVSQDTLNQCAEHITDTVKASLEEQNKQLISDVNHLRFKNQTLTSALDRMSNELGDLKNRVENLEISSSKKSITITGLSISNTKKDKMILEIQEFFEVYLGVIVVVEDCYKMGGAEPKLIVVHLQTMQEKNDILRFKSALKDIVIRGKKIFINEFTPNFTQEKRRKERYLHQQNELRAKPFEMSYNRGNLIIQGETYKQKITPPTASQQVNITPEDLTRILAIKTKSSQPLVKDKSIFQAYTAEVRSFSEIHELYIKMKLIQPSARHIVCAFSIEGEQHYYTRDFHDDDEIGAGKNILALLTDSNLQNRVVFISRKYGGIKMSSDRFTCYQNVAREVLEKAVGPLETHQAVKRNVSANPTTKNRQHTATTASSGEKGQNREESTALPSSKSNWRGAKSMSGYRAGRRPFYRGRNSRYSQFNVRGRQYNNIQQQRWPILL